MFETLAPQAGIERNDEHYYYVCVVTLVTVAQLTY
jgi:hypothetical protein